jgi:hypothetical protein
MLLPAAALKAPANKPLEVEVNGEVRASAGKKTSIFPLPEQAGQWPNIKRIFPTAEQMADYSLLVIDTNLLTQLASAISSGRSLALLIPPTNSETEAIPKPIIALGFHDGAEVGGAQGIGLVMPLSISQPGFREWTAEWVAQQVAQLPESITIAPAPTQQTA